jgi:cytoskeleton protein RodZ
MAEQEALDFGAQLAAARKLSGLTLDEVARRTKIRASVLSAIERCDVADLPGGIYVREFLRVYAREVGCDPEAIVRQYRTRFRDHVLATESIASAEANLNLTCASGQVSVAEIDAMTRRWRIAAWMSGSAALLLVGVVYLALQPGRPKPSDDYSQAPRAESNITSTLTQPTAPAVASATAPDRALGTTGADKMWSQSAVAADAGELRLDLKPTASCWLSAKADGRSVLYRLMKAGERAQIQAREEVVLTVGDPAGCGFDINGFAARQLGAAGRPVTIHLTPKNYAEFLRP